MAQFKRATTTDLITNGKYSNAATNTIIETLGFTTKGDGGGALWKKTGNTITASQTPAQTGTATCSDALGNEFAIVTKSSVNVLQMGAVNDGSTDNTSALQAAFDFWVAELEAGRVLKLDISGQLAFNSSVLVSFTSTVAGGGSIDCSGSELIYTGGAATALEFRARSLVRGVSIYDLFVTDNGTGTTETVKFDGGVSTSSEFLYNWSLFNPRIEGVPNIGMIWTGNYFECALFAPHITSSSTSTGDYCIFFDDDGTASASSIDVYGGSTRGGQYGIYSEIGDCKIYGGTFILSGNEAVFLKNSIGGAIYGSHVENAWEGNAGSDQAGVRITGSGIIDGVYATSNNGNHDTVAKVFADGNGVTVRKLSKSGGVTQTLLAVTGTGIIETANVKRGESVIPDVATQRLVAFSNNGQVVSGGTTSGTIALDMDDQDIYEVTANGAITFDPITNPVAGDTIIIRVSQDGVGGRTVSFNAVFKTKTAADTTASLRTVWTFYYTGGSWLETSGVAGF